jgi:hypothetical protein
MSRLVVGLELEGPAQRTLVALGHQQLDLRRRTCPGGEAAHEVPDDRLRLGADEAVDHLAVAQGVHGGDRLDPERR